MTDAERSHGSTDRDPRVRAYVAPTRVAWPAPAPPPPPGAGRLIDESALQPSVWRPPLCTLACGVDGRTEARSLVMDFGCELHGGVEFVVGNTSGNRPVPVRVTFGESLAECLAEPDQDHALHRWATELPWAATQEIGCTGFRFVRLELVEPGTFVELHGTHAVTLMRPDAHAGTFESSDPRVDAVWQTSARTLHLCMQRHLWDGVKRDRLVWAGDLHPEVMAVLAVFGPHRIVPESLDFLRADAPRPAWMNGMPTYSLWWVITLCDWYWHAGDTATVVRSRDYVLSLADTLAGLIDELGRETLPSRFLDWASHGQPEAVEAGVHALARLACQAGADLCGVLGADDEAARLAAAGARAARFVPAAVANKQANAMRVLAGLADPAPTNAEALAPDAAAGLSPFYGYYVLEARALAGDVAGGLNLLRDYWGGMLDLGATSFWEHFDLAWLADRPQRVDEWPDPGRRHVHRDYGDHCYRGFRHSLCHAWSAGPAAWLARHVLGVTPAAPGFRVARVEPRLGDLRWARGTVPTPHGPIHVTAERRDDGGVETRVDLPVGVTRQPDATAAARA